MHAVIMAGGKGSRLSSITKDEIPKPMALINGKSILEYQIDVLRRNNIFDIIIVVGYLHEQIENYFGDGNLFGVNIKYIREIEPLGTAGAFYYIKDILNDDFILVFGDIIFDIAVNKMLSFHKENNSELTLLVHPNSHPYDSDIIMVNESGRVINFDSKNNDRTYYYRNLVNAGIYIVSYAVLNSCTELKKRDLERDIVFPLILNNESIFAYETPEYVKDVGTPDRLISVEEDIKHNIVANKNLNNPQKCIFLDRDGTINKFVGLLSNINDLELEEKVSDALKLIHKSEYLAVVITNQPVVARNLCSIDEVHLIHNKMETLLGKEGAFIDGIEFCPHHPDKGYPEENKLYKIDCDCRKPKIGLIRKSVDRFNIDLANSWFIGDSEIDIQTGFNAGTKTILLKTGIAGRDKKSDIKANVECDNLLDAVVYIINWEKKRHD